MDSVAMDDPVYVAYRKFGSVIFNQAIGLHDVGTNLATKRYVEFRIRLVFPFLRAAFAPQGHRV